MSVTELAILRLAPGVNILDAGFRAKILRSKQVMETALGIPGRRFVYYQDAEDPMVLYLLGDWQSTDEHWNEFIPSPENQELLELLKHDLDVPSIEMYHVDIPAAKVPTGANVISIGWHKVRQNDKVAFETTFWECKKSLDEDARRDMKPAGGWRVEKAVGQQETEEFVLFCGRESVDEQLGFSTRRFPKDYGRIREFVQEYDIKHGNRIVF
ncbi:hypothetical protein VMCG_09964 [Cytospora schulzeri]|uniref:ABM domain-containing protein n=1 Tax=Cytospora schulzeri TaxID=448051 RepID=A0A423VJ19_9PEZI|nr:hypothetical protein VMCG_09964 [Valsa malicola]